MTERSIIFDANAMRALRAGRKTQARLLASAPLRTCRPGDRLWVKEACTGGRMPDGGNREYFAPLRNAQFVAFPDGWRQHRDGRGHAGPPPNSQQLQWAPAIHMPRWASRVTLIVECVRAEPLWSAGPGDMIAEGAITRFAGLYCRWQAPMLGIWRNPEPAYAALWNMTHGTPGERWEDNPRTIVIGFRADWRATSGSSQTDS